MLIVSPVRRIHVANNMCWSDWVGDSSAHISARVIKVSDLHPTVRHGKRSNMLLHDRMHPREGCPAIAVACFFSGCSGTPNVIDSPRMCPTIRRELWRDWPFNTQKMFSLQGMKTSLPFCQDCEVLSCRNPDQHNSRSFEHCPQFEEEPYHQL